MKEDSLYFRNFFQSVDKFWKKRTCLWEFLRKLKQNYIADLTFFLYNNYIELRKEVAGLNYEELFKKMLMTFDHKYEAASVFYDNLPYVRDYDLCNWTPLRMVSGNIIKYYQYKLDKPVIIQTDPDGY